MKITREGQECRHCKTPVRIKRHPANWKPKAKQPYYFEYWFACTNKKCGAIYMVESAKRWLIEPPKPREDSWLDEMFERAIASND